MLGVTKKLDPVLLDEVQQIFLGTFLYAVDVFLKIECF